MPLLWGLSHLVHPVAGEGVSRSLEGDLHRGPRIPHREVCVWAHTDFFSLCVPAQ
ncbi:hypothetical protein MDA_GLEAN10000343 [Myotis davidii]|uniref:Uncharacterized protein n=1 Tax=Myotis davidii TaxID=225400 RepID=L5M648_MYODS|nr:hypothetical protein MDA_GLEAN10000343 [Myotis davidii]